MKESPPQRTAKPPPAYAAPSSVVGMAGLYSFMTERVISRMMSLSLAPLRSTRGRV